MRVTKMITTLPMKNRESTKNLLEKEKAVNLEELTAPVRIEPADYHMWMDFEQKMRILVLQMMNPMIDTMGDDRIALRKEQETTIELEKRIDYLEEIVLYKKKRIIESTMPNNPLEDRISFPKPAIPNSFTKQDSIIPK